jgi:hypothetical protein
MATLNEIPRKACLLTSLPNSLQVMIIKLADNHAATVGVCKSMKVVSDEAQVLRRKELVADIPDWEKNWDAFNYITRKEWGEKGYTEKCNCKHKGMCSDCNYSTESEGGTYWEIKPRYFRCSSYTLERMTSKVFGDRCLTGFSYGLKHPPFRFEHDERIIVFHRRTVLVSSITPGHVHVKIHDHLHDGIKPVLINKRFREVKKNCPYLHIDCFASQAAAKIISVLGESDFAIDVYEPHSTCIKRFLRLDQFRDYDEDVFMEEAKKSCEKHHVGFVPTDDVEDVIVMRAWDNGPIAFYWNHILFTSDVVEGWIPDFALELF